MTPMLMQPLVQADGRRIDVEKTRGYLSSSTSELESEFRQGSGFLDRRRARADRCLTRSTPGSIGQEGLQRGHWEGTTMRAHDGFRTSFPAVAGALLGALLLCSVLNKRC